MLGCAELRAGWNDIGFEIETAFPEGARIAPEPEIEEHTDEVVNNHP